MEQDDGIADITKLNTRHVPRACTWDVPREKREMETKESRKLF
jgi:hypothetical protein